ncbi:MAG: aryldialkylphosphatase [Candidatus Limnocylindrales bacterium]
MQVMTVSGLIDANQMGVTDAHDHLFLRSPILAGEEIQDPAAVAQEMRDGARSGLATIVELTPIGLGRRPELLRMVSEATGVHVIGATGYHRDAHYPPGHWVLGASELTLINRMRRDLTEGMHPTDWSDPDLALDQSRAGVIKVGASLDEMTPNEARRLACAAAVAAATGAAVVVHTEVATCADEITDLLVGEGLPVEQIILAHMDRNPDPARHIALLERGVMLVYDTIGRTKYHPDRARIDLIEAVCAAGRGDQILLGLDIGRASTLHVNGGYGLRYLMDDFVPRLRGRIGESATQRMLIDNAAAAFALRTPVAA